MNPIISQLDQLCQNHGLNKKALIVPSHRLGQQLLQTFILQGKSYLNLHIETIENLAIQHCKQHLHKHKLQLIPPTLAKHYLHGILENLLDSNQLTYFRDLKISPSFVHSIYTSLNELKLAGFHHDTMSEKLFVHPDKGTDIKRILEEYHQHLQKHGYLDEADLFQLTVTLPVENASSTIYLLPSHLQLNLLQRKSLDHISQSAVRLLDTTTEKPVANTDKDRLFWLHDIANSGTPLQDSSVQLIKAYGEMNEVREILRRIKTSQIPFDLYSVFYTSQEPYAQFLYECSERYQIPITFGDGIGIRNTRPGRLFFTLLNWIADRYRVSDLIKLLNSGDFHVEENQELSPRTIGRMLRAAGIGWDKKRYISQLDKQVDYYLQRSRETEDGEKKTYFEEKANTFTRLRTMLEDLLSALPEAGLTELVEFRSFAASMLQWIDKHSKVKSEKDAEAKTKILDELTLLTQHATERLLLEDAIKRLEDIVGGIRIAVSGPKPGHLHVDHYRSGYYHGRKHHMIIGLDNRKFPGGNSDDPILLDKEREQLGQDLPMRANQSKENTSAMLQLLLNTSETLLMSYSCINPLENKELYPAAIMLQVYRLLTGDEGKDYSQFIRHFSRVDGFIPHQAEDSLDENEWWINHAIRQQVTQQALATVISSYPALQQGQLAAQSRANPAFTHHDGRVNLDAQMFDPRVNKEKSMSASKLETLAKCPYAFFIAHILVVQTPDDWEYDPDVWLSAAERGTLLHEIFERFLRECKEQGIRAKAETHIQSIWTLANEVLIAYKEVMPPPSDAVYEKERKEIRASCQVFLKMEEEVKSHPEHFELIFGKHGIPVEVQLPSGQSYFVDGKIDRIDRKADGSCVIIDYKTGSTYGYSDKEYFKGGRQLQHALYAIAYEEFLRKNDPDSVNTVSESGYIFPTVKGEGSQILRPREKREGFPALNEKLLDIVANGHFVMTDDASDCKYCDYRSICNRSKYEDQILAEKRNDSTAIGVTAFREVRTYG